MDLSLEQVAKMAPDASSAAAGKKLSSPAHWSDLGRSPQALWGKCKGSAVYQVRIELSSLGNSCSCPSRKFPCKHVLGLMMLAVASPAQVGDAEPPDWVAEWLAKREASATKKAEKATTAEKKPVDEKAQAKRAEQRDSRVLDGIARLDLWLADLVRQGLAGLEHQPSRFWDDQARRLVDAQAPGLATRVRQLSAIPGSSRDWPSRLLGAMGRLKLALDAYQQSETLPAELRGDLRHLIGYTTSQDELDASGEVVEDRWLHLGQWTDDDERIRVQRTWALGETSGRMALILQFAPQGAPFAEALVPGTTQRGQLQFYPPAGRQRARWLRRDGELKSLASRTPGDSSVEAFLTRYATQLAAQPWLTATGCVLREVTLVVRGDEWLIRDASGSGLPLHGCNHWIPLAVSGGRPFDLFGEWDGRALRPLGLFHEGVYRPLAGDVT